MSIKSNREKAAKKQRNEQILKDVKRKNILETKTDVEDGKARLIRDEFDNIVGASGGKYLQKLVYIAGIPTMITGKNEAELEKDYADALRFAAEHGNNPIKMIEDVRVASELIEAEIEPDEELIDSDGKHYFLIMKERLIMDSEGNTVIDASDVKGHFDDVAMKEFLKERFKNKYGFKKFKK